MLECVFRQGVGCLRIGLVFCVMHCLLVLGLETVTVKMGLEPVCHTAILSYWYSLLIVHLLLRSSRRPRTTRACRFVPFLVCER